VLAPVGGEHGRKTRWLRRRDGSFVSESTNVYPKLLRVESRREQTDTLTALRKPGPVERDASVMERHGGAMDLLVRILVLAQSVHEGSDGAS